MAKFDNVLKFYNDDYSQTLFPMETNRVIINAAPESLYNYIRDEILGKPDGSFLTQTKVYASKHNKHLRKTSKLDPLADFFIYELVYRNRNTFRKDFKENRINHGFRFEAGKVISPRKSYRRFRSDISNAFGVMKYAATFDISSYFNTIYHHDLVFWFNDGSRSADDVAAFDKYFKQINAGKSVDFLPHGIMPCKIVGSHYLKFVDNANRIKSDLLLRFMDDFYIFSNSIKDIEADFNLIQKLLSERNLYLNPLKTNIGAASHVDLETEIDAIKEELLEIRREALSDYDTFDEDDSDIVLTEEHIEYLLELIEGRDVEEEDAELVLTVMKDNGEDLLEYFEYFLQTFPNLMKNIYRLCEAIDDKEAIATVLNSVLEDDNLSEYQLFWFAHIIEAYLLKTSSAGDLLIKTYEHSDGTMITQAKILEIPENKYGMDDLREEHLRTGQSDWLSWASAIGARKVRKSNRNQLLSYFSNSSPINNIIGQTVIGL